MPYVADPSGVLPEARAFWVGSPGRGEMLPVALPEPGSGDVVIRTLRSGVSRGTETLVFRGGVPPSQHAARRVAELGDDAGRRHRPDAVVAHQLAAARLAARQRPDAALERGQLAVERIDHRERHIDPLAGGVGRLEPGQEGA